MYKGMFQIWNMIKYGLSLSMWRVWLSVLNDRPNPTG